MSTESIALAVMPPQALGAGASALREAESRLATFKAFVQRVMTRGVDYAVIPGTPKPSLLKAGAERIAQLYGLTAVFEEAVVHEDWSAMPPFFSYRLRCKLISRATGECLGEGFGSSNSRESKYAYRVEWWNDRKNPPPEGQGWEPHNGKFGKSWRRRVTNMETPDVANTVLKMAKKRAFVDAVLTVAAASEFFAQDLEDMPEERGTPEDLVEDQAASQAQVEALTKRVREATSIAELQAVANDVSKQPKAVRTPLRPIYSERLKALREGATAVSASPKSPPPQEPSVREPGDDSDDFEDDGGDQ